MLLLLTNFLSGVKVLPFLEKSYTMKAAQRTKPSFVNHIFPDLGGTTE